MRFASLRPFLATALAILLSPSTALAAPPPDPAAVLRPGPLGDTVLDIDFRTFPDPAGATSVSDGIVSVTAGGGTLVQNADDCSGTDYNAGAGDGFGVSDGDPCDDGIDGKESLTVDITAAAGDTGTAAFDVTGIWLADLISKGNGEAGIITLYGTNPTDVHKFSFSWKDVNPSDITTPNPNDEFFVGFYADGHAIRFTRAVVTSTSGSFSVVGFSNSPITFGADNTCGGSGPCDKTVALGVNLDLGNANAGLSVSGTLYKEGVYIVQDPREYCDPQNWDEFGNWIGNGAPVPPEPYSLPVTIEGYDLEMLPHQCGYPASPGGAPVFYVINVDGGDLSIVDGFIPMEFQDEGTGGTYFCSSPVPWQRPAYGWVPKYKGGSDDEFPVVGADGSIVHAVQDVTTGPCGSGRGNVSAYSLIPYHFVNYPGTNYTATVRARIQRLQDYVQQLFACISQHGVEQSSLSDDVNHIADSFDRGQYPRTIGYAEEMREHVQESRVYDQIADCSFDLDTLAFYEEPLDANGNMVHGDANVVGALLVMLDHIRWMVYTTLPTDGPEADGTYNPAEVPPLPASP